jgi:predicted DNA-binding transcriptional regulator AlpA
MAQALYDGKQADVATICRTLGISRATFYRYVRPPSPDQLGADGDTAPPPREKRSR